MKLKQPKGYKKRCKEATFLRFADDQKPKNEKTIPLTAIVSIKIVIL